MMLRSVLRLGTERRIAVNLLNRVSPNNCTRQFGRRPVRVLNEIEEESPLKSFPGQDRSNKKKDKVDIFRQSNVDGQYYIKSEIHRDQIEGESDDKSRKPLWIEDENDFKFSTYMMIVKSRNKRRKEMITMLEGKRLISDAILAGTKIVAIFVSLRSEFRKLPVPPYDFKLHWMPYRYFQKWSDVKTSSGLMAIAQIPSTKDVAPDPNGLPLTVICDNIRDPGNMGAILRVLAAIGSSKVLITKGCVDIWEPKVLRAGAGGHFRVPIEYDLSWDDINSLIGDEVSSVYVADSGNINYNNAAEVSRATGSDSDAAKEQCSNISNENSNNAAGVSSATYSDAAKEQLNNISNDIDALHDDAPRKDSEEAENPNLYDREKLQAVPYYEMQFHPCGRNILVISNEHFGPSQEAVAFAAARQGVKVHIPLCGNVESLNVVSALSVITFEMKRQAVSRVDALN